MVNVESSNIEAVGVDLRVRFKNGGTYVYPDVAPDLYERFINAESKGKFFHAEVKPLPFVKVES